MENTKITQSELFEDYPDVLTVQQVRQCLGIGRVAVYKLLGSGISCFKIGNAYKIPKTALVDYITQSCKERGKL